MSNSRFVQHSLLPLALAAALFGGCSTQPDGVGQDAKLSVALQALDAADVTRVTVAISGPGIAAPIVRPLRKVANQWVGLVSGIPAGVGRTFLAEAFTAGDEKLFSGQTTGVTIMRNQTVSVIIVLQPVTAPTPFVNSAPSIGSLVASSDAVAPGESVSLNCVASDPDAGDSVTFGWQGTGGSFSAPASGNTLWTAPALEGAYSLTIRVADRHGASHAITVVINVAAANGRGNALINSVFNVWPVLANVTAEPSHLAPGGATALGVVATDADGDVLSHAWTSGCGGTFSSSTTASPTWTAPATAPATGQCALSVVVSDGRGGSTTGTLTVQIGANATANIAPVIESGFQSTALALPGEEVLFGITAHDPEGQGLSFAWSIDGLPLGGDTSTSTTSEALWTAAGFGSHLITVVVSDGTTSTTAEFPVAVAECRVDAQCGGATAFCVNNVCQGCSSDMQCGTGRYCDAGTGTCGFCTASDSNHCGGATSAPGCTACGAGSSCAGGVCACAVSGAGDTCMAAQAGICSGAACVACTASAQCGADSCCNEGAGGVCYGKSWERIEAGGTAPSGRSGVSVAYDRHQDRLLVFGGIDNAGNTYNDLYALDLTSSTWSVLLADTASPSAPARRHGASAIYDSANRQLVIFGGATVGSQTPHFNDVWSVSFVPGAGGALPAPQWSQVVPSGTLPSARRATQTVYDEANARMIVFGGYFQFASSTCTSSAEVWELSLPPGGSPAWTQRTSASGPRHSGAAIYDPHGQRMLVFGGSFALTCSSPADSIYNDLLALSLPASPAAPVWSSPVVAGSAPTGRFTPGAYDSHVKRLVVWAGRGQGNRTDTAVYGLSTSGLATWSTLTPTTPLIDRYNHGAIYDPVRRRFIVVGGDKGDGSGVVPQADFVFALPLGCL